MPTPKAYEALLKRGKYATQTGDALESSRAYWSARKCSDARQEGDLFTGSLSIKARVVDAADISAQEPSGLTAPTIYYECGKKPRAFHGSKKAYHASGTHQGRRGLFEKNVYCEIEVSWYPDKGA